MSENPIEQIYTERLSELIKLCRIILSGEMIEGLEAEDVVHRVFIRAWEKKEQLSIHENPMGWFRSACVKECQALRNRKLRRQRILGFPVPLTDTISADSQSDAILRWLNKMDADDILQELHSKLTPFEKQVFRHYYAEDMSAQETAEIIGVKVTAVNDAARRIRSKASKLSLGIYIFLFCPIWEFLRRK